MFKKFIFKILFVLFIQFFLVLTACGSNGNGEDVRIEADFEYEKEMEIEQENYNDFLNELDFLQDSNEEFQEEGDVSIDEFSCPEPPSCAPHLVRGTSTELDENGCPVGYCCNGMDVTLREVVIESSQSSLSVNGICVIRNTGDREITSAILSCKIINPEDGSVVATCEDVDILSLSETPLDTGVVIEYPVSFNCSLESPEPCFDPVNFSCDFSWETSECYSTGEGESSVVADFNCI